MEIFEEALILLVQYHYNTLDTKIINESSIRTSLDARSQKDKVVNLSQYNENKISKNDDSDFKIQLENEENQEEYIVFLLF